MNAFLDTLSHHEYLLYIKEELQKYESLNYKLTPEQQRLLKYGYSVKDKRNKPM